MNQFKPVQVPCKIKDGMEFVVCMTELEFAFIRIFEKGHKTECLKEKRAAFELTDLSDLVNKGILLIEEGVGVIHYELTQIGRKLIYTIVHGKNMPALQQE